MKENIRRPDIEPWKTAKRGGIADRVPNFEICIGERECRIYTWEKGWIDYGCFQRCGRKCFCNSSYEPMRWLK